MNHKMDHYDNTTTSTEEEEEPPNSIEIKPTPIIKATIITVTAKGGGRKGRNSDEERKDEEELEETGVTGDDLDDILAGDLTEQEDEPTEAPIARYTTLMTTTTTERAVQPTTLEDIARISAPIPRPIEQPQSASTEILERLLSKGYDWRVRPHGLATDVNGGPVVVNVNMLIRRYGIKGDSLPEFLILTAGQQIWMPDSFFQNEKQAYRHMIDKPNVLTRVHKDGTILYSVRISLVLSCPMDLHDYPMDQQRCVIELASYAYTTKDIEYVWKKEEPVQKKFGLDDSLPSFILNDLNTSYCTSNTNTGAYSCLRITFYFKRQFSYYLLQLYIPSTMLVIVSWVSFWLDRTAVPARVTLGVTTLLTMTTQSSGINAKLPPVAYIKV
ncbi:hypothetical protein WR25_22327 isoform A [Diploscapter pachys]|uniref:Uncharacterized protein n=1 Tax=Diploscapter pachys TaxID=2018661 RepID=A0A2A2L140_9BILA|nr:hypothetical protein WR25_22327 isoform A [Diploscapter pachys]